MNRLAIFVLPTTTLFAGCLSVPSPQPSACSTSSDCTGSEVCEEGVCWGEPPIGQFAATLSPPSERDDLVPVELASIALPADGWLGDLSFEPPVMFSGRVEAYCASLCDSHLSLDATITISRPARFAGGPSFRTIVDSVGDLEQGESFHVALPRTHDGDAPYTITIVPANRNAPSAALTAAEMVPPLHLVMDLADASSGKNITLGEGHLAIIDGAISSNAIGLANYRVAAIGHWDETGPAVEVSSVAYTGADGHYAITLASDLVGPVEIVARPVEVGTRPTLHLANVDATKSSNQSLLMPAGLGDIAHTMVVVTGDDGSGKVGPIAGARVVVRATMQQPASLSAVASFEVTTDAEGKAPVQMFNGTAYANKYRLSIVPPPGSNVGAVFDDPIDPKSGAAMIEKQLARRLPITGTIIDTGGNPLAGVSVTAHPALRFAWSLPDGAQAFLGEIPAASTTSTTTGEFVVYVDPMIAATWGTYELVFDQINNPNGGTTNRASNWRIDDIQLPRDATLPSLALQKITLPDASFIHGHVIDLDGIDVEGAELKLFQIGGNRDLCTQVAHAPLNCPIPADLQGRGATDDAGIVRLTLPRPRY